MKRYVDAIGRVVLPKKYREALGIAPEDPVELSLEGNAIILRPAKREAVKTNRDGETVKG